MRSRLYLALVACCTAFLAACGDDPVTPPDPPVDPLVGPITGQWSVLGHGSVLVEVGIYAPGDGTLAGCIAVNYDPVSRPNDRTRVVMAGSRAQNAVQVAPAPGQGALWTFTGSRTANDTITGTGTLSGGSATTVRLARIAPAPDC